MPTHETARELIADLAAAEMAAPKDEFFSPSAFVPRIRAVGDVPSFVELMRTYADSTLQGWMLRLAFYWKDMPYETWRQILREVASNAVLMYQLGRILSGCLAIDVMEMVASDPVARARVHDNHPWRRAGGEWWEEICEDYGLDYRTIWRRLAAEGAPMNVDVDAL
jgi:hypothetical protein